MGVYCKNADRCSYHPSGACDLIFECVCFEADTCKGLQSTAKKTVSQEITPKEEKEQEILFEWCNEKGIPMIHIPNERKCSVVQGAKLKRQGVRSGFPDNLIPIAKNGYHGLFIELKRAKKVLSKKSPEQREWIKYLNAAGYKAVFCYGAEEAKRAVLEYIQGAER